MRLAILRYVVQGGVDGVAAGTIGTEMGMVASTLSHHLNCLVRAQLLRRHAEGTFLYYSAEYSALKEVRNYLWRECCQSGGSGRE